MNRARKARARRRRKKILWLGLPLLMVFLALFSLLGSAQAAEQRTGWWLQIKSAACAQGPKVLLGDIALPQGEMSASAWKEMSTRPLWASPERHGHQTALSRERLLALLRFHAEDIAGACALPSQLVVQRGGKALEGNDLNQRIVGFLTAQGPALGGELEIKELQGPEYIFLPSEHDRLDVQATSPLRPGRINLLFEVKAGDGKVQRRYAASAFVNVWKALPVPLRAMNRLEQLSPANVQFKRKNLAYNENAWDGTGGPWRMVKSVGVDQVIRITDIEPVPVIAKGDKVNLVYAGENIRLQVKAEALSDAGIGQSLQVRNLQSNRKITAVVQDAATVMVR